MSLPSRGAVSNPTSRFEPYSRDGFDDGWSLGDLEVPALRTLVRDEPTRTILTRNDSPDISFDRSINPYKGCEHGCIYCFARPTHAYLGMSPGLDFESRIVAKPEAAQRLREELGRNSYRPAVIALGANTDPYQPVERARGITRSILEVLSEHNHPVSIITKSALILRDLDLLSAMAKRRLAAVFVSVTSLDRKLARVMEPRAATPERRLETLRALSDAGVPTGVLSSPMIPAVNDSELEAILEAAHDAGARSAGYVLLRLPLEIKDLFREWLKVHFPDRVDHVLSLVRETRDGALYQSEFGTRMRGTGAYADMLRQRFRLATMKLGLNKRELNLDTAQFTVPPMPGSQLRLF